MVIIGVNLGYRAENVHNLYRAAVDLRPNNNQGTTHSSVAVKFKELCPSTANQARAKVV